MPAMSVSPEEVARFDALAASWWDPNGPMRALHRMNPARVQWIVERVGSGGVAAAAVRAGRSSGHPAWQRTTADGRDTARHDGRSGGGMRLLDIGCGAGVAAEALARRGFNVVGLDAAGEAIEAARAHAAGQDLPIDYRIGTAEDLLAEGLRFPVITALEVIEHVLDPVAFLTTLRGLLAPCGQLFLSTLNRTPRSFLAAKVAAEYLLRWLPVGTHDWRRFITPAELSAMLRDLGFRVTDVAGLAPDPLTGQWRTLRDTGVNYLLAASI
jgi:2-polyprenyl-6-hydroxyphenyl methylase / 3-demethylubiquinone-9 3-methyltransferase